LIKFKAPGKSSNFKDKDLIYFSLNSVLGCQIELSISDSKPEDHLKHKVVDIDPEKVQQELEE